MPKISVVCGTRGNNLELLLWFFQSLESQIFEDFDVNIVCDRSFTKDEELDFLSFFKNKNLKIFDRINFYTNQNSDFNPNHQWWASYVRNFWIQKVKGEFIQLFDDDDRIEPDFLEKCLKKREEKTKETNWECVILPSLYFRDTDQIQNQWFSHFNYLQSRPTVYFLDWKSEAQVQMFSGNGLFSLASTLRKVKYDETIARIAEDMDYTISLHEKWVKLRVFADLKVRHFEREKLKLEQARIGSYQQAKQKSRNRFLFIHKHGNKKQIFQFYCCWLPWCLWRLSWKALLYWKKDKWKIISWLFAWVKEWWKLVHKSK